MEFNELVERRRACHTFVAGSKVEKEDLIEMVKIAGMSPSGYNAQPWEFICILDPKHILEISTIAFEQSHIKNAGAIIVVLSDSYVGRNVESILEDMLLKGYCTQEELQAYRNSIAKKRAPEKLHKMAMRNAMLAAMTFIYAAENMGYQTCPIMGFPQWKMKEFLRIPDEFDIALLIAIGEGVPTAELPRLKRKTPDEMIRWEFFSDS